MKLTTKGRYAVMAILEIASHRSNKPVTLNEISVRQNIPVNYLEQIFVSLRKAKIVRSFKGPNGGYIISDQLTNLKITNIIDAVDENIEMTSCSGKSANGCMNNKIKCDTHYLWLGLSKQIRSYFDSISIADMLLRKHKQS